MRRSLAIGGSLTRADTERLLDTCQTLLDQRAAIAAVLGQLGPSCVTPGGVNQSARIVGARPWELTVDGWDSACPNRPTFGIRSEWRRIVSRKRIEQWAIIEL